MTILDKNDKQINNNGWILDQKNNPPDSNNDNGTSGVSSSQWVPVSDTEPCPICGSGSWCSRQPSSGYLICRRRESTTKVEGWQCVQSTTDKTGAQYTRWISCSEIESANDRDQVYSVLLQHLPPTKTALQILTNRGFSKDEIQKLQYSFLGSHVSRSRAIDELIKAGYEDMLSMVPGFYQGDDGWWKIAGGLGILIPVRNVNGNIIALLIRAIGDSKTKSKYTWLSSKGRRCGTPSGTNIHVPLVEFEPGTVRITEGALKADIASLFGKSLTIGLAGLNGGDSLVAILKKISANTINIAFDADFETNPNVAHGLVRLFNSLKDQFDVNIEVWDPTHGKGIDDILVARKPTTLIRGPAVDDLFSKLTRKFGQVRKQILVEMDEASVNHQAASALATDPELFARGGKIVNITPADTCPPGISRPNGLPQIRDVPISIVREKLSSTVEWIKVADGERKLIRTPVWATNAITHRGHYPEFRALEGIVTGPVLRKDGTILSEMGYDHSTGLYLTREFALELPEQINQSDAKAAATELLSVVSDFPFEHDAHKSTWLALVLTMIGRNAYDGVQPLFLFDSNTPGTGKGLLFDLATIIAIGEAPARMTMSDNDDEMRKRITSIARAGDSLVMIDNLTSELGGSSLEAAMTSERWKDRLLGVNETVDVPLRVVWCATGNNIVLSRDMTRRVAIIRLVTALERPERRTNFTIPDIRKWCHDNRDRLLTMAFTVIRGFHQAGCPNQHLTPWGSFEGWSGLVRSAIVWAGLPDPGDAREELETRSNSEGEAIAAILDGIQILDPENKGVTTADILGSVVKSSESPSSTLFRSTFAILLPDTVGLPTAAVLGRQLGKVKDRVVAGRCLISGTRNHTAVWKIKTLNFGKEGATGVTGVLLLTEDFFPKETVKDTTTENADKINSIPGGGSSRSSRCSLSSLIEANEVII